MDQLAATGLQWSASTRAQLTELSGLLTAIEHLDEPIDRHSLHGLEEAWDEHGSDPERNVLVGRTGAGPMVAYAWVHPIIGDLSPRRVFLTGGVHPGWRGKGIGSALLSWQQDRAREWYSDTFTEGFGPLQIAIYADEKLDRQARLYRRHGFEALRWFADMALRFADLPGGLPEPQLPPGVWLVPFSDEWSEAVRQAHNEAFTDHWGAQPVDEIRWKEQLDNSSARPDWSWVALAASDDGPEVAGYAMNGAYDQDWEHQGYREGWTDRLGVRRHWRGQGLAKALLAASMRSFADAGMDAAGLGVDSDNPSGALRLYEGLGYRSGESAVMYGRTEHPGSPTAR